MELLKSTSNLKLIYDHGIKISETLRRMMGLQGDVNIAAAASAYFPHQPDAGYISDDVFAKVRNITREARGLLFQAESQEMMCATVVAERRCAAMQKERAESH